MNPFKIPLFDNFFARTIPQCLLYKTLHFLHIVGYLAYITSYDYNYKNRVSSLWPFSQPLLPEKLNFSVVYFPKHARKKERKKIQKRIITTGNHPELLRK